MRKTIVAICMLLASLACVPASRAQNDNPQSVAKDVQIHFYRLKLVVEELDEAGKITNNRSYSTDVSTKGDAPHASIRARSQVPYVGATSADGKKTFSYYDVGANFDISRVTAVDSQFAFNISGDISSYAFMYIQQQDNGSSSQYPYIRHNQWEGSPVIPLNKPTVIFTSDAIDGKGSMQVVATVTLIP
jgi:hypothetical protein